MTATLPVTGNTSQTKPENRAFYPALDGLRTLAFVMVLLIHYHGMPWGWTGVDLFFVLSGFLITGILFDSRDDQHRVYNFYIRRTLRIFPLYYAVLLLPLLTLPLFHWDYTWQYLIWPTYLGNYARFLPLPRFVGDFQIHGYFHSRHAALLLGHLWSLCVEEQFYLLWPMVVFWIRDRRILLRICLLSVPVCLILRLIGNSTFSRQNLDLEILYRATPFRLDALLIGGALALLLRGPRAEVVLKLSRWLLSLMLVGIAIWMVLVPTARTWSPGFAYPTWRLTWGLTLVDMLFAFLILQALEVGSLVYRVFSLPPLRWLGRLTYGAYVFHDIFHMQYGTLADKIVPNHHGPGTITVALISSFLLAYLSFRFFESPFLRLKDRLTRPDDAGTATLPA